MWVSKADWERTHEEIKGLRESLESIKDDYKWMEKWRDEARSELTETRTALYEAREKLAAVDAERIEAEKDRKAEEKRAAERAALIEECAQSPSQTVYIKLDRTYQVDGVHAVRTEYNAVTLYDAKGKALATFTIDPNRDIEAAVVRDGVRHWVID